MALVVTDFGPRGESSVPSMGSPTEVTFDVTFPLKGKSLGKQSHLQMAGGEGLDSGSGGYVSIF